MTSMSDLQVKAIRAVAEADPSGPNGKLPTIHVLRGMTDKRHTLREYIDAVEWAMARPRYALTRAEKERAVAEMTKGLAAISENYVHASLEEPGAGDPKWFARKQELLRKAIVRVAMARTVD